jgi:peroxiredoxin
VIPKPHRASPWLLVLLLAAADLALLLHNRSLHERFGELPTFMLEHLDPDLVERLSRNVAPAQSMPAPDLSLVEELITPAGDPVSIVNRGAKLLLLVFVGAYDCISCLAEISYWQERGEPYSGDDLQLILVGSDRDAVELEAFMAGEEIEYPLLHDRDGRVRSELGILAGPTKLLFDVKSGVLLWRAGPGGSLEEHRRFDRALRLWMGVAAAAEFRELLPSVPASEDR